MKINSFILLCLLTMAGMSIPLAPLGAVHSAKQPQQIRSMYDQANRKDQAGGDKKTEKKKEGKKQKMDGLSLAAHIVVSAGIASFFLLPGAGLILLPAGFIMGVIAWSGGRKRYERKKGRGLALAAMVLGGAVVLAVLAALTVFVLTY